MGISGIEKSSQSFIVCITDSFEIGLLLEMSKLWQHDVAKGLFEIHLPIEKPKL